ncbi:acid protease, partial [Suhomyces tanzawaensis NRRL Y-17324]
GSYSANLTNENVFYTTNITVGSEKKQILVDLDTGSSDLWVLSANGTDGFASDTAELQSNGYLDAEKSTSLKTDNNEFFITYGDNTFAYGEYVTDSIAIPNGPSIDVEFGLAFTTVNPFGIFGIGFDLNEAGFSSGAAPIYNNYPATLKKNGLIGKNAYSLYLNSPNATTGSVIFGGYDTKKVDGSFATLQTVNDQVLAINVDSVTVGDNEIQYGSPALLDSGTTITYLPRNVYQGIIQNLPGSNTPYGWRITTDEAQGHDITYKFNDVTVKVPVSSLVGPTYDDQGKLLDYTSLQVSIGGSILGDNFLRYAYVIFNLDDQKISVAQAKFTDDSDIQAI